MSPDLFKMAVYRAGPPLIVCKVRREVVIGLVIEKSPCMSRRFITATRRGVLFIHRSVTERTTGEESRVHNEDKTRKYSCMCRKRGRSL